MEIRELQRKHELEKEGWTVVKNGAPDFLCYKKDKDGKITNVKFDEVKSPNDKLKIEQHIWRKIMKEYFNANYIITIID